MGVVIKVSKAKGTARFTSSFPRILELFWAEELAVWIQKKGSENCHLSLLPPHLL